MSQSESLNDLTYHRIWNDIMDLTLEPGSTVSVQKLADLYGVSRTPAREAVIRLQRADLVKIFPQAKTMISKINLARIEQEQFIRKSLELALVDDFLKNCSPLVIDAMEYVISVQKKYVKSGKYKELMAADNNFHRIIFETAGQNLAWNTINDVLSHYNRLRMLSNKIEGIDQNIINEHESIVTAVKNRNAGEMRVTLTVHLEKVHSQLGSLQEQYSGYFEDQKEER
ncbi:GntR family transcriptional regulator [Caproiciproducens sp. LBM24188]|nr:GntR family transcriptional regulator [Oscillospiraceae bacterium]HHV32425.1 GntR family transcriptional regulator [Clostridiales bacterium]